MKSGMSNWPLDSQSYPARTTRKQASDCQSATSRSSASIAAPSTGSRFLQRRDAFGAHHFVGQTLGRWRRRRARRGAARRARRRRTTARSAAAISARADRRPRARRCRSARRARWSPCRSPSRRPATRARARVASIGFPSSRMRSTSVSHRSAILFRSSGAPAPAPAAGRGRRRRLRRRGAGGGVRRDRLQARRRAADAARRATRSRARLGRAGMRAGRAPGARERAWAAAARPARLPPTAPPMRAQHVLELDGAVEQREAHEQRLHQQLLLSALAKARLELADRLQHAQQVGGRRSDRVAASSASRARSETSVAAPPSTTASCARSMSARPVSNAAEVDAGVSRAARRRERHRPRDARR